MDTGEQHCVDDGLLGKQLVILGVPERVLTGEVKMRIWQYDSFLLRRGADTKHSIVFKTLGLEPKWRPCTCKLLHVLAPRLQTMLPLSNRYHRDTPWAVRLILRHRTANHYSSRLFCSGSLKLKLTNELSK